MSVVTQIPKEEWLEVGAGSIGPECGPQTPNSSMEQSEDSARSSYLSLCVLKF